MSSSLRSTLYDTNVHRIVVSAGALNKVEKGKLKDLILREDKAVMAAVEVFETDHDVNEMLDTLRRIVRLH